MQRLTAAEKRKAAEFKQRRNQVFGEIDLELKATGSDPQEAKDIELAKEKVIDNIGNLSEKQSKVEEARKIISREKRLKDARKKTKRATGRGSSVSNWCRN